MEKIDESKGHLPATAGQKKLIAQLLCDLPKASAMLEYEDYRLHPTRQNASEFISTALEWNLELLSKRENYVDYLANRPHVERIGEHGLFTDAGKPVVIARVQEEVKTHKGPVWTHVISLKERTRRGWVMIPETMDGTVAVEAGDVLQADENRQ